MKKLLTIASVGMLTMLSFAQNSNAQDPTVVSLSGSPVEVRGNTFRIRLTAVVRNHSNVRWDANGSSFLIQFNSTNSSVTQSTQRLRSLNPGESQQITVTPNMRFSRNAIVTDELPIDLREQSWRARIILSEFNQDQNNRNNERSLQVKRTVNTAAGRITPRLNLTPAQLETIKRGNTTTSKVPAGIKSKDKPQLRNLRELFGR